MGKLTCLGYKGCGNVKVDASMMSCAYSPATGVNAIDFEHSANHTGITLLFDHEVLTWRTVKKYSATKTSQID